MGATSIRDVAALAGVSVGTVSNVLNRPERVSSQTVEKVHDAIAKSNFVRNDAARQLRAGRSRAIGLIVLDVGNPFFTDLARGVEEQAARAGFSVLLGNSDESERREAAYLDLFEEQRVHGVLISPLGDVVPRLERLRARGTPSVLVDRQANSDRRSSASVDDVAGGYLATSHLISQGRHRVAFIAGPSSFRQVQDRLTGARQAVQEAGDVTLEILETDAMTVLQGRHVGESLQFRQPGERPDAIFAANDLLAIGALQGLMILSSIRVPEEIAIIGYDDIAFNEATIVPLSSIRQPSYLIGQTALELLLREAEGADDFVHESVVFRPELVVRESSKS